MSEQPLLLDDVLWEECEHIARRRGLPPPGPKPAHDPDDKRAIFRSLPAQDRWALCLSGGGIRSATFALGVLQGLAQCGLLQRFDYLSTVSGGGYVGGWLTGWIQRHRDGLEGVVRGLKMPLTGDLEPSAIRHLRDYSNYLTPKLGALSADTWTLVSTYLRNLVLHWLVLLPPLLLLLLTPKIGQQLVRASQPEPPAFIFAVVLAGAAVVLWRLSRRPGRPPAGAPSAMPVVALLGALGLLALAVMLFAISAPWLLLEPDMPTSSVPAMPGRTAEIAIGAGILMLLAGMIFIDWNRPATRKRRDEQTVVLALFLVPVMTSAVLLALGWSWMRPTEPPSLLFLVILGIGLRLLSWWVPGLLPPHPEKAPDDPSGTLKGRLMRVFAAIVTGAVGGILVWQAAALSVVEPEGANLFLDHSALYACLAPPVLLAIFGFSEILFIGIASFWTEDEDREWWGRSGAWLLIAVLFWGGLRVVALFGPPLLAAGYGALATLATAGIAGVATAFLGFSSKTADVKKSIENVAGPLSIRELALTVLAPIFIVSLFALLSLGIDLVLAGGGLHDSFGEQMTASAAIDLRTLIGAIVALLIITGVTSACVNVNKFSLHAMYRYRLIRAYLGASHKKRHPHPFTGFDDADNIPMHDIWPNPRAKDLAACDDDGAAPQGPGGKPQPIHVVNISLNLVSGRRLAWQQRKAEAFTVSPLHCGSRELGYRRSDDYGGRDEGISLGTAVTISGAAASPNMGYHSSAVVTFIMSLFNVRLGWWLGNPGPKGAKTYMKSGPGFATAPLLAETFGMTNDENPYVYLSDGGHFENLGLYEMVTRRCRVIVVSDAACDASCGFQDLGNAIRKIRIDLGIEIRMNKLPMRPRQDSPPFAGGQGPGSCCAIGRIVYPAGEKLAEGLLIYLKPGLYGGEPVDVLNYAAKNATFPHESTGDQWFSEAQFESYRALGVHIVERAFGNQPIADADDLETLEKTARKYAYPEQQF